MDYKLRFLYKNIKVLYSTLLSNKKHSFFITVIYYLIDTACIMVSALSYELINIILTYNIYIERDRSFSSKKNKIWLSYYVSNFN